MKSVLFAAAAMAAILVPATAAEPVEVAITFDDFPSHGQLPPGTSRLDVTQSVIDALKAVNAPPVYGLINATSLKWEPQGEQAYAMWRKAGNMLGNHTFAHSNPGNISAEAFTDDIAANEPMLKKYMDGADWHYLRLPFLRAGDTTEKRDHLTKYMTTNGYRLADVTIGFNDFDYNSPFARCMTKGDQAAIQKLKVQYLTAASHAIDRSLNQTRTLFGRDIRHVFLMHFGAFDALMLPAVLDLLKIKNFKLIGLPEAESDPVYTEYGTLKTDWAGFLQARAMMAKNQWLSDSNTDSTGDDLAKVCQ